MTNKYHRKGFKLGSGKILKAVFQGKKVESKLPDDAKIPEQIKNIYKLDKTGKKDKIIESLNNQLKKNPEKFPKLLDVYTRVMGSDFVKKTGPYFKKFKKDKDK